MAASARNAQQQLGHPALGKPKWVFAFADGICRSCKESRAAAPAGGTHTYLRQKTLQVGCVISWPSLSHCIKPHTALWTPRPFFSHVGPVHSHLFHVTVHCGRPFTAHPWLADSHAFICFPSYSNSQSKSFSAWHKSVNSIKKASNKFEMACL